MIVNYTVGDYSDDGHGKTDHFVLKTNVEDVDQIRKAYLNGVSIIGFDIRDYCNDYEDSNIPEYVALAFAKHGVEFEEWEGEYSACPSDLINAVIATVKVGDESISIEVVEGVKDLVYVIGGIGYGCFW